MVFEFSVKKICFVLFCFIFFFDREFFYQQIEKYARQCLTEGIRNIEDLIVTPNSELYRALNVHYNRSNQITVIIFSFKSNLFDFFRYQ
jgi:hypothetical protein